MVETYDPAAWVEFFFTVAAAAAALTGLIVVGLSIHANYIAESPTHRAHARATLVVLTATMVTGLAGTARQPPAWAAWEFGAISVGFALVNTVNNYRTLTAISWRVPRAAWRRMAIGYAIAVAGVIGATTMLVGSGEGGGLYWIAIQVTSGLVWAIASAWRFLIGVADEKRTSSSPGSEGRVPETPPTPDSTNDA